MLSPAQQNLPPKAAVPLMLHPPVACPRRTGRGGGAGGRDKAHRRNKRCLEFHHFTFRGFVALGIGKVLYSEIHWV